MKQPSAWIPLAMSFVALAVLVGFLAKYGIVHEVNEGAAARTFQLLMVGQLPIVVYFAAKWLPRETGNALRVLALQACAGLIPLAVLYWTGM